MDFGGRVAFGSHDDVCVVPLEVFEEHGDIVGIDVAVSVHEGDVIAGRFLDTIADSVAFALVFCVAYDFDFGFFFGFGAKFFGFFPTLVYFAVDDDDHFVVVPQGFENCLHGVEVSAEGFGFFVGGDDNGEFHCFLNKMIP